MIQKDPVWEALHKLWTWARSQSSYNKDDWMDLERCIIAIRKSRDSITVLTEMRRFLIEETNNVYRKIGELEEADRVSKQPFFAPKVDGILTQPTTTPNTSHRDVHSSELGDSKATGKEDS